MTFLESQFNWHDETKTWSQEASTLGLPVGMFSGRFTLLVAATGQKMDFIRINSNDELVEYRSVLRAIEGQVYVVIFND